MITRANLTMALNANNMDLWDTEPSDTRTKEELFGLTGAITAVIAKDVMTAGRTTETLKVEKMLYCFINDAVDGIIRKEGKLPDTDK